MENSSLRVAYPGSSRYPDPAVEVLDPAFLRYRIFSASVEQLGSGLRWAEGPVWFGDGRYLLFSDIPNNRIMRWDETTGGLSVFRQPANHSNGLTRDRQGRLVACEHLTRRITRTEYDGSLTVLADRFDGKRFNSPNDIICAPDCSIWFTDPVFGISGECVITSYSIHYTKLYEKWAVFVTRQASTPSGPSSDPKPLSFTPWNGASAAAIRVVLTPTMPLSMASTMRLACRPFSVKA